MALIDFDRHGVCLRRDALGAVGRHRVVTALRLGEVVTPWRGVLVDAHRAADPLTQLAAARLAIGAQALLAGPSASYLHGFASLPPTPVHVVLPYEHRKRDRTSIIVHSGRGLLADREERHGLPVLCLERVLVDLLCTVWPPKSLAVLDEALAGLPSPSRDALRRRLRERLEMRPDPRGTRIATRLVDLATGRAESPPESWLLWLVVDLGFPIPEANVPILDVDGRTLYRADLAYRELRIALEYNGYAAHAGREDTDQARVLDFERRGWIVIVVDVDDLSGPARFEKELHEAFLRRGVALGHRTTRALRPRQHRASR